MILSWVINVTPVDMHARRRVPVPVQTTRRKGVARKRGGRTVAGALYAEQGAP